jgi:hypothetical protein
MFPFSRYKQKGLPYGLIALHERMVEDIFLYFEKGRFVRKKVRKARKAAKAAIRFATKKKAYPSNKTSEALKALAQIDQEIEYTDKVIRTAFEEVNNAVKMIRQEKVGGSVRLMEKAREQFKKHNFEEGMELLKLAQEKLRDDFLPKSRKAILGGLDREIRTLKKKLLEREAGVYSPQAQASR